MAGRMTRLRLMCRLYDRSSRLLAQRMAPVARTPRMFI